MKSVVVVVLRTHFFVSWIHARFVNLCWGNTSLLAVAKQSSFGDLICDDLGCRNIRWRIRVLCELAAYRWSAYKSHVQLQLWSTELRIFFFFFCFSSLFWGMHHTASTVGWSWESSVCFTTDGVDEVVLLVSISVQLQLGRPHLCVCFFFLIDYNLEYRSALLNRVVTSCWSRSYQRIQEDFVKFPVCIVV
jgi:hypothetical protein